MTNFLIILRWYAISLYGFALIIILSPYSVYLWIRGTLNKQ
jgi:hypothetical protein